MFTAKKQRLCIQKEIYRRDDFAVFQVLINGEVGRLVMKPAPFWQEGTWLEGILETFQHPRYSLTYRAAHNILAKTRTEPTSPVIQNGEPSQTRLLAYLLEQARREGHTRITLPKHYSEKTVRALENKGVIYREGNQIGLTYLEQAELRILAFFHRRPPPLRFLRAPKHLSKEQCRLWRLVAQGHVLLSGAPGTGKSLTAAMLADSAEQARLEVILLAPTGKGVLRLTELSGRQAFTIHSALGWNGPDNPLKKVDLAIIDEANVVDVEVLAALIAALPPHTHVVMIGDPHQLPPIGPGAPFRDLLRWRVPQVTLTQVQRRAKEHPINQAAYVIREGKMPVMCSQARLRWQLGKPERLKATLLEEILGYAKKGERPQVLSSSHQGPLGIDALNQELKQLLNPGGNFLIKGIPVTTGDPLIQLKNDYALGLINGQMMEVQYIDKEEMLVRLDDGNYQRIPASNYPHMQHAYAINIHQSQGSQWEHVAIVLCGNHRLLNREMIYTALTRAQTSASIYGEEQAIKTALSRQGNQRKTWIKRYAPSHHLPAESDQDALI